MGRRGNMRSRPGLLFVIIFAICLVIVYLSWRSMSPGIKVKDTYSAKMQTLLDESSKWRNAAENREGENHDRDPDYDLDKVHHKKPGVIPALRQYDASDEKENINKEDFRKRRPTEPRTQQVLETDKKDFYRQPNDFITETVKSMERFVHLDLKGAAPRIGFFESFFPLLRKLGATGLLIEYEDMFPYTGKLKYISAKNAYTITDINKLLELARLNSLKVMPLIQTFGHMEFVLKSVYGSLRESSYTPQVIDITKNDSYSIISEMVKQILNAHPDATHLHIGCDEVYELGKGATSLEMKSKKLTEPQLFLRHVQRVANIVRFDSERDVIPVIWDDELRKTPIEDIANSKLPSLVEIMIWHYTKNVGKAITNETWKKYAKFFKSVWIASAFKGATGARQLFTEPQYHIQNHLSWLDAIAANKQRITFKGVALTGWQRFDHFATLCDLLPVAVPSLAVCLATMMNAGFTKDIHMDTSRLCQCSNPVEMTFPQIDNKTNTAIVTQDCRFPGSEVYHAVQELYGYKEGVASIKHRLEGWLSDYQIAHKFSSPGQLKVLSVALGKQSSGLSMVTNPLKRLLSEIYFDDTVDEWMDENIFETQRRNQQIQEQIQSLGSHVSWPQRPLPMDSDAGKLSTFNVTEDDKAKIQYDSGDQSKNAQPVQKTFQYVKTKYQGKPEIKNEQLFKSKSQPENPFPAPVSSKSGNEKIAPLKDIEDLSTDNQATSALPNRKLSKEESNFFLKRSNDLLDRENSRKYNDIPKQHSKIDEIKETPIEFKPELTRTKDKRGTQSELLPKRVNSKVNAQLNESGNIRREKLFGRKTKTDVEPGKYNF